jgi:hypothetical protein
VTFSTRVRIGLTQSAILLLLCMVVPVIEGQEPADVWGQPVEGMQMKLTSSANIPSASAQLPGLELELRNNGSRAVTIVPEFIGHLAQIEVDGVWYSPAGAAGSSPRAATLLRGATARITLKYQTDLFALDANGSRSTSKLLVTPGRHTVRVRTPGTRGVTLDGSGTLVLTSNSVASKQEDNVNVLPRWRSGNPNREGQSSQLQ